MDPVCVSITGSQSSLCNLCQLIFWQTANGLQHLDPNSKLPDRHRRLSPDPAIPDMWILSRSEAAGCHFCRLVLYTFQNHVRNLRLPPCEIDPENTSEGMATATTDYPCLELTTTVFYHSDWDVTYFLLKLEDSLVVESLRSISIAIRPFEKLKNNRFEHKSAYLPTTCTESIESWDQCKTWIRQCVTSHVICNSVLTGLQTLPSRLIDVSTDPPTLCTSDSIPPQTPYITLSHCWGDAKIVTLTSRNLVSFQKGLPLDLPKSFQQAIKITRRFLADFGVRYLWIDSICIIQDSVEDWLRESPRMGDIYGNAFCNLASTAAIDGTKGLFFERDLARLEPLWVRLRKYPPPYRSDEIDALCVSMFRWRESIEEAPLNCRGWVYQEQHLSPRILHFARNEIFWQCQYTRASETFPYGEPELTGGEGEYWDSKAPNFARIQFDECADARKPWGALVEEYCKRQLSHPDDKLSAISGVAQRYQKFFENSQYLAGLWRFQLERQLLWSTHPWRSKTEQVSPQYAARRTLKYRAPSWSWASLDGYVSCRWTDAKEFYVQILDAQTTTIDGGSPFGEVSAAFIRIRGKLFKADLATAVESPPTSNWIKIITYPPLDSENIVYTPDIALNPDHLEGQSVVYCMPFYFDIETYQSCYGLVLEATGESKGQFKRLGTFTHVKRRDDPDVVETLGRWRTVQGEGIDEFEESHGNGEYTILIL